MIVAVPPAGTAGRAPSAETRQTCVHATCVAVAGHGVLLRGPSGAGKSDLALRLIDGGAVLVADDRTLLTPRDGRVVARAPAALAGLIEVRGIGPLPAPAVAEARVALIVDLVPAGRVERLPAPATETLVGVPVPRLALDPRAAATPAALRLLLAAVDRAGGAWPVADEPAGGTGRDPGR